MLRRARTILTETHPDVLAGIGWFALAAAVIFAGFAGLSLGLHGHGIVAVASVG